MKELPIRVQRSRQQKQVSPNGLPIVYVGRPSMWGNPFKLSGDMVYVYAGHIRKILNPWVFHSLGGDPVEMFRDMMMDLASHDVEEAIYHRFKRMRDRIKDLEGKNLSCWCNKSCKCHADVLLDLANNYKWG